MSHGSEYATLLIFFYNNFLQAPPRDTTSSINIIADNLKKNVGLCEILTTLDNLVKE